jgi:hypothetical protein
MKRLLAGLLLTGVAAILFAVSASATWGSAGATGTKSHVQRLSLSVVSVGRGASGDEVRPFANFAIAPGVPVKVTVTNFTNMVHTFTVPGLHVSRAILPARRGVPTRTTFTFTAHESGTFAWRCVVCVSQHHVHRMAGTVYAILDPSELP